MLPDRIFTTFRTASQGLAVQRENIATASRNIANSGTSAPEGSSNIYRVQSVQSSAAGLDAFEKVLAGTVSDLQRTDPRHLEAPSAGRLNGMPAGRPTDMTTGRGPLRSASSQNLGPQFEVTESDQFRYDYDPAHPDADENGMVRYPDVDLVREMTRLVSANRLYEANLSAIEAEKEIIKRSMEI